VKIAGLTVNGSNGASGESAGIEMTTGSLLLEKVAVTGTYDGEGNIYKTVAYAPVSVQPSEGTGSLTILDSTIAANVSTGVGGVYVETPAGSAAQSTATIVNSTIAGNYGGNYAGAVGLAHSQAILRDDTLTGNEGKTGGLRIGEDSTASVTDSIIAANKGNTPAEDDCQRASLGASLLDGGHNLIGVSAPGAGNCAFENGSDGDIAGTSENPLDPQLEALANNGGTTQTMALQTGSPAIGAGNPADCETAPVNDLDQRGAKRNAKTRHTCDIGAYDTGGTGAQVWYVSAKAKAEPEC
jgi:hypothetical protein